MNRTRLYLVDLLRLVSMGAIVSFHVYDLFIGQDLVPEALTSSILNLLLNFSRPISFSGLSIVVISFSLWGFTQRSDKKYGKLFLLILLGILYLLFGQGESGPGQLLLEWDIYHYLLVAISSLYLMRRSSNWIRGVGILGFLLLCIPFWNYESLFQPLWLQHILIGVCDGGGRGGWGLLPWIGVPWLSFALGAEANAISQAKAEGLSQIQNPERIFWLILLAGSLPFLGAYIPVLVGPRFYCFIFRQDLASFWAHIVWIYFVLRLSLHEKLNHWLGQLRTLQYISELHWSRRFGRCYFLSLLWCGVLYWWAGNLIASQSALLDLVVLTVMPTVELISRAYEKALDLTKKK